MRCTDSAALALAALLPLLVACGPSPSSVPVTAASGAATALATAPASGDAAMPLAAVAPQSVSAQIRPVASAIPAPLARNMAQLKLQVARRIVEANPGRTYLSAAPDPLLAIPVLQIELNVDGSVRRIEVLRYPRQARDTTQLAIDAVRRAAPLGDVSKVPGPLKFSETFLFDDERRFKPRTLEP